jgi:hypothetical protein
LIGLLATVGTLGLLSRLLRNAKPNLSSDVAGAIEPEKASAWFTVIGGGFMAFAGLFGALFRGVGWGGVAVAVVGLCIASFMSPSLTSVHMVSWGEEGIEGPSNLFGPTLGLRRARILWSEITKVGTTITGYWFVQARDGHRVYWSFLYKGYGALVAYIEGKRPDLILPARRMDWQ